MNDGDSFYEQEVVKAFHKVTWSRIIGRVLLAPPRGSAVAGSKGRRSLAQRTPLTLRRRDMLA